MAGPDPTPSRWSSRPWQWALTALLVAGVPCLLAWPRGTVRAAGALIGVTAVVVGVRMLNAERHAAADDDLTAQEARDLADDLSLQLYRAQDALAYVGEMCDIADEHRGKRGQPATVTTTRVREWLRGAQCARQAGLVIDPDTIHRPGGTDA